MSTSSTALLDQLPWDDRRGTGGMILFIITEASLFAMLFFAYFFLSRGQPKWPADAAPKLTITSIMLLLLLTSSVVVQAGKGLARRGQEARARLAIAGTAVLGVAFLVLQSFEYRNRMRVLPPTTDAYSSIFYTITSLHALHVMVGIAILIYLLLLPRLEQAQRPPYRALHNGSLYWHFVDGVWVVVMLLLYYLPHLRTG